MSLPRYTARRSLDLHEAANKGYIGRVRELLESRYTEVDYQDDAGYTALMAACASEDARDKCVSALLRAKASVDTVNYHGQTALILACQEGHLHSVRMLIDANANVNCVDVHGCTALMFACQSGYDQCVHMLVMAGANLEAQRICDRFTPLLLACSSHTSQVDYHPGHKKCVLRLILAGANVNAVGDLWIFTESTEDMDHTTPLMIASQEGKHNLVGPLIRAGASVNYARDVDGCTALMDACASFEPAATHAMIHESYHRTITELIENGADIEMTENSGQTALMIACLNRRHSCARALIDANAKIHQTDDDGATALMLAAHVGNVECVRQLLDANADVNQRDVEGQNALLYTCTYESDPFAFELNRYECVCALLKAGAEVVRPHPREDLSMGRWAYDKAVVVRLIYATDHSPLVFDLPNLCEAIRAATELPRECEWGGKSAPDKLDTLLKFARERRKALQTKARKSAQKSRRKAELAQQLEVTAAEAALAAATADHSAAYVVAAGSSSTDTVSVASADDRAIEEVCSELRCALPTLAVASSSAQLDEGSDDAIEEVCSELRCALPTLAVASSSAQLDEGSDDETGTQCVICFDAPRSHMFTPCGHRCVCESCAASVMSRNYTECPMCRTHITGTFRVFL